jgi:RNA polymerase sigma-70 factor (ECF subfamily)
MKVQNQFESQFVFLSESAKREQIEILFRENRKRLQGAAKAVTKNSFDAEDAVQNVFLKLLERDGVPASYCRNPKAYLWQATHREALNIVRNQKSRRVSDDPIEAIEIAAPQEEPGADPSRVERLRRAMKQLDEGSKELLYLHYWQGRSQREIAAIKGWPKSTVDQTLKRIRDELKKDIRAQEREGACRILPFRSEGSR